jgi:hypothetical protein
MARLLVCLPLCLLLSPVYPIATHRPGEAGQVAALPRQAAGLFGCPLTEPFPARLPWAALFLLGDRGGDHPGRNPIAFLEKCLKHYDRTVKGYSLTLRKREYIDGTLHKLEVIDVHFKDEPHSVFFKWRPGTARKAARVVYVEGKNDNKMLVKPAGAAGAFVSVVTRDVDSPDAKQSGRYPINEFGLKKAMQRVLVNWKRAAQEKALHVEYLGIHTVAEAGDRPCFKFRRTRYARPEDDGVTDLTMYIDTETLLQVGSVLRNDGEKCWASTSSATSA